jgi:hypothetical protein
VKVVMTLLVRDEADVIRANLDFHLHAGVDHVIVTDHGSVDETPAILEEYVGLGVVDVLREPTGPFRQREWMTRMSRLAATRHGADWVINGDADEFWWPRGGSLKEVLAHIPHRYGVVQSFVRHFVPVAGSGEPFFERMVYRLGPQAAIHDPTSPWRPFQKVVHRAAPDTVVTEGAHALMGSDLRTLRGWYPIEVLHFPIRSPEQFARKGTLWAFAQEKYFGNEVPAAGPGTAYHALAYQASEQDRSGEYFDSLTLSDDALDAAVAAGILHVDSRLRDTLRLVADGGSPTFPRPNVLEDALFAVDVSALGEADVVRTARHLGDLDMRLAALERTLPARIERRLRRLVRTARSRGASS